METIIFEHGHHAFVFGENIALKNGNAIVPGNIRQPLDKLGANSLAVVGILDGKNDPRRALVWQTVITPDGNDFLALLLLHFTNQSKGIPVVHGTESQGALRPHLTRVTLKAKVFGLLALSLEKSKPALGIVPAYRPQQYPGTVFQQDLGLILKRVC